MEKIVIANWKNNIKTPEEAERLVKNVIIPDGVDVVFLPPVNLLKDLIRKYPNKKWGTQDFYEEIDAEYVLVGHSTKRARGDTDEVVNEKVLNAVKKGSRVILAVGEPEREREGVAISSLKESVKNIPADKLEDLIIAYEPIWAISINQGAEPDDPRHANKVIGEFKRIINTNYIYGGSVDSSNITNFISQPNIEGVLVGAASIDDEEFSKILSLC